jgi:hypothetical protein
MKMNQKNAIRSTIGRTEINNPIHCGGLRIDTSPTFSSRSLQQRVGDDRGGAERAHRLRFAVDHDLRLAGEFAGR